MVPPSYRTPSCAVTCESPLLSANRVVRQASLSWRTGVSGGMEKKILDAGTPLHRALIGLQKSRIVLTLKIIERFMLAAHRAAALTLLGILR